MFAPGLAGVREKFRYPDPRMSLSSKVLLGLGLGVLTGLFFGEGVAFLEGPGNAFASC